MKKFANFHFKGQQKNEVIIKVVRRHWFNIFQQYLTIFAMLLVLIFSLSILPSIEGVLEDNNLKTIILFAQSSFAILIWIISFTIWIDFYFDVWIITNKRIVNIEQKALFIRHVSELKFTKIQDVTTEIEGFIPTILNYGEVYIQTAGTKGRFLFHQVSDPYKLKSLIMDMHNKSIKKRIGYEL